MNTVVTLVVVVAGAGCGANPSTASTGPRPLPRSSEGSPARISQAPKPPVTTSPALPLKPIADMCALVTAAEASQAMGATAGAPAASTPETCAYVSSAPAPGVSDNANLSFGIESKGGRAGFDDLRQQMQITDVGGVGDAAIIQDNQNGSGKLIFVKADTIFSVAIANDGSAAVTNALTTFAKLIATRV